MSFVQSALVQFVASPAGRIVRIVVGLALIAWGYTLSGQSSGTVLVVVGLLPLLAGALDICLVSRLLGGPLSGAAIRRAKGES